MSESNTLPLRTTNFFSPQDNFFIIDSQNLDTVTTKFYGFSVQENGIYDRQNMTPEALAALDGTGTYISIERTGDSILIRQDFTGSYGLYLYNKDGRFVLSNSFLYLMEYLSKRVRLTLNRDYAHHFLTMILSSMAYSETFLNEVELLPRDVAVKIDIPSKSITTERIYYGENQVRINSREGFDILDKWFSKWTGIFRNLYGKTCNIEADLSGGLDTRMSFILLVNSGIDLNRICIHSIKAKGYTFNEDYEIASEIGRHFGFGLNNYENFTGGELNHSTDDIIKLAFYIRMFVETQLLRLTQKFEDKHFRITGHQGESMRTYWHPADKSFMNNYAFKFSAPLKKYLTESTAHIITHLVNDVSQNIGVPISDDLSSNVFRDTWGRSHFGAEEAMYACTNLYMLNPLGDSELARLKLNDPDCTDQNLLMAVMYKRYCPELLNFRFTKNDTIHPATQAFAEKISAQFPRAEAHAQNRDFSVVLRDPEVSKLLAHNNTPADMDALTEYVAKIFRSPATRKLFASCFDEELCAYAEIYFKRTNHHALGKMYTIITTTEVIKHVIMSEATQERSITDDFREFAESGYASSSDKLTARLLFMYVLLQGGTKKALTIPGKILRKLFRKFMHK